MKKKAQLGNLQGIIVVLIIVGILLGAGFFIFDEFIDQTNNNLNSVINETILVLDSTGGVVVKNNNTVNCFNSFSISSIVNASDELPIGAGNYTFNATTGRVFNISSGVSLLGSGNGNDWNISYSYKDGGSACIGITATTNAMLTIPELLGLIVLIAMIGIILAVIFNVIPGARVSGA